MRTGVSPKRIATGIMLPHFVRTATVILSATSYDIASQFLPNDEVDKLLPEIIEKLKGRG